MNKNNISSVDYNEEQRNTLSIKNEDDKTKRKSRAQKVLPWLIVSLISLIIILMCTLIAYYQVYKSSKQNANVLEGVYASSYYSMVDNVNNLSVDLAKYSKLSTVKSKSETLHDVMVDCNYIIAGLSVLPINEENVIFATKFFNQINGLCEDYSQRLNSEKFLSIEEELVFDKIAIVVGKIKANLNQQNYGMYDAGFNFVDASIFDNTGMNELSVGMGDLTSSSIEYPSMIFDGPFSTALETKVVKGLPKEEVDEEKARDYLLNTVYKNRDVEVRFERETNGDVATYDYDVKLDGKDFNVQVSKRGGLLMTISGYAEGGDPIMSGEQAIEIAKNFTNNIGFENMESVWIEVNENVAYINLAPVENDVIMYPDLVKVKVDLTSQDIIGFEALNYAMNHVERNFEFNAMVNDAENLLGFDYEVLKTSKAIIKLDSGKEVAVFEFVTERIDGTYFYYIDANTIEIVKTLKLVNIKNVEKLI